MITIDDIKTEWNQVSALTWANMKSRYRKTIACFLWVVMNPVMMYGAQSLAFKTFLRLELPNFYLFLAGGLLPWIFLTSTMDMTTTMLQQQGPLLKAFKISPFVLISSQLLDNFINFAAAFLIILTPIFFISEVSLTGLMFLPAALLILIIGVYALSWLLAVSQVYYRDTRFVVQFTTSVMFFLTPIFYPVHYVPEKYRHLIDFNPFYALIEPVRTTLYNFDPAVMTRSFIKGGIFVAVLVTLAYLNWRSKRNELYLHL